MCTLFPLGKVLTGFNRDHLVHCCEVPCALTRDVTVIEFPMLNFESFHLSLANGFSLYVMSILPWCDYITNPVPKLMTSSARTITVITPCTL